MVTHLEKNIDTRSSSIKAAAPALEIESRYIQHYIYLNQDKAELGKDTFKLLNHKEKNAKMIV